MEKQSI